MFGARVTCLGLLLAVLVLMSPDPASARGGGGYGGGGWHGGGWNGGGWHGGGWGGGWRGSGWRGGWHGGGWYGRGWYGGGVWWEPGIAYPFPLYVPPPVYYYPYPVPPVWSTPPAGYSGPPSVQFGY